VLRTGRKVWPGIRPEARRRRTGSATMGNETELDVVARHVREDAARIARLNGIIAKLRAAGLPTKDSEKLLATSEAALKQHAAHLVRLTRGR
jgi:hypothetical protein